MGDKKCVFTICSGDRYEEYAKITYPLMEQYAKNHNADCKKIEGDHWTKLDAAYVLLEDYDIVLYVDADVVIRPDSPSIFRDIGFYAHDVTPYADRRDDFKQYVKTHFGVDVKPNGYFNSGVFVANKKCKNAFKYDKIIKDKWFEQSYLNWNVQGKYNWTYMPVEYNHIISYESYPKFKQKRENSYFIHFAGQHDRPIDEVMLEMRSING